MDLLLVLTVWPGHNVNVSRYTSRADDRIDSSQLYYTTIHPPESICGMEAGEKRKQASHAEIYVVHGESVADGSCLDLHEGSQLLYFPQDFTLLTMSSKLDR